ncbi:MAG: hypothetical protein M3Q16_02880 [Pseudomonadota bacterium]|nr:hypothetical protein [Pseudomonadota bacterium]
MATEANRSRSRFWLGEHRLAVRCGRSLVRPRAALVKVDADDGNMYVLRYDETSGNWEIAAYRAGRSTPILDHSSSSELNSDVMHQRGNGTASIDSDRSNQFLPLSIFTTEYYGLLMRLSAQI